MWFDTGCCEIELVLCQPAACILFHRSACRVENTTVSKLLRLRFMQLHQVSGFNSRINNIHFLVFCEVTLLRNWLQTFREKVWILYSKGQNDKDGSAL